MFESDYKRQLEYLGSNIFPGLNWGKTKNLRMVINCVFFGNLLKLIIHKNNHISWFRGELKGPKVQLKHLV